MGIMIQTAVLVIVILAVRKLAGEKLHAYIRYGLWLAVVLRLLIPVNMIDSPFSILHMADTVADRFAETGYDSMGQAGHPGASGPAEAALADQPEQSGGIMDSGEYQPEMGSVEDWVPAGRMPQGDGAEIPEDGPTAVTGAAAAGMGIAEAAARIFPVVRTVGSLVVGGFFILPYVRFRRRLYRTRSRWREEGRRNEGRRNDGRRVGCRTSVPVYRVEGLKSPCLVGVIHPAVYIDSDLCPDSDYFRYALTHERVHYFHGDHFWALLRTVLVIVYWFHPFVWIAAAASARDGEIACDYGTIKRLGDGERLAYGEMLLKLSAGSRSGRGYSYGVMPGLSGSELKERILRLTGGGSRRWAGILAIGMMLVMAGCAFTGAPQESKPAENGVEEIESASDRGTVRKKETESIPEEETESVSAEHTGGSRELTAVPAEISADTEFGVDGPILDYAGRMETGKTDSSVIIFHDYSGLVVYDLTNREVLRSLELASIGCNMTQGDNACQVAVSADGSRVWLHPIKEPHMFRYEVEENRLYQIPIEEGFEADLGVEELFDRYLATEESYEEWHSNYLYEEYEDEKGIHRAYIYLYVSGEDAPELGNLRCVWDDMVFSLWEEDAMGRREDGFPYRYEGVAVDVELSYEEPCEYSRVSDSFGSRINPATGAVRVHEGIDYAAEAGTEVRAAAAGIVYETGFSDEYGLYVVLLHPNGDMTYYCNCQEITVSQGDEVEMGDRIAAVGNTGRSIGAHLHFAFSRDGVFVDPAEYLAANINSIKK